MTMTENVIDGKWCSGSPAQPCNVSRRDFLKVGTAAFGGLAAASALPALADDPSLFPCRGRWERLSIVSQHVTAGASKPFSILHISDTHLTAAYPDEAEGVRVRAKNRSRTFGGRQEEALRDTLAWAKQHVDYVVHTGDMIDFQSRANFDLVRKYYGESGAAMLGSLGNHEYYHGQKKETEETKGETRELVSAAFPFDTSFQSTVVNGVNFVTLDNVYGTVTQRQAECFAAEVEKGLPIVLCMHCPIQTENVIRAGQRYWQKDSMKAVPDMSNFQKGWKGDGKRSVTQDFYAYLEAQPLLKAVLAGHIHVTVADRFSPSAVEYVVGGNFLFHGQEITIT